eukprot:758627-Prorocentrum_minimum.AAC.1
MFEILMKGAQGGWHLHDALDQLALLRLVGAVQLSAALAESLQLRGRELRAVLARLHHCEKSSARESTSGASIPSVDSPLGCVDSPLGCVDSSHGCVDSPLGCVDSPH